MEPNKNTQEEALEIKINKQIYNDLLRQTLVQTPASCYMCLCISHYTLVGLGPGYCVCGGVRCCVNACVLGGTSSSVPPLRPPLPPPHTLRHHDTLCHMTGREPEVDRTMLLVLAISLRDNKRQQKGFQRKYSSIALYPLNLGYWFKYETCTPQEK